jgi:hypothetical protein
MSVSGLRRPRPRCLLGVSRCLPPPSSQPAITTPARISRPRMAFTAVWRAPASVASRRPVKDRVVACRAQQHGGINGRDRRAGGLPRCILLASRMEGGASKGVMVPRDWACGARPSRSGNSPRPLAGDGGLPECPRHSGDDLAFPQQHTPPGMRARARRRRRLVRRSQAPTACSGAAIRNR